MILVVGPGRCASSSCAKFLHENGIFMGHRFVKADDNNPQGYYEDTEFNWLNNGLLMGNLSRPAWGAAIRDIISRRQEPWGFKDPKTADLIGHYIELLPKARFIRCRRDREPIIISCMRCYGWSRDEAAELVGRREKNLDEHLEGFPVLDVYPGQYGKVMDFCNA